MKRAIIVVFLLAVVGGGAWGGLVWYRDRGEAAPQYRTAEVKITDVVASIAATGTIVPEDTIDVGAQVNGQIASFGNGTDGKPVDYRSEVAEGALLAKIDDALYAADVATSEAQLAQARAQVQLGEANRQQAMARLTQSRQDWSRAEKLGISEALSQADYDAIKSAYDQAVAAVAVAEAQIGQAQAQVAIATASVSRARRNLAYCQITSPVSGVIIDKRVDVGQTVVASLNAPSLFLIAKDLRKMLVLVQVNEADIADVEPGKPVTFTVDGVPGRSFQGVVRKVRLNATMTQNVVTYTVEISTENADLKLLPYLTANVSFVTARREKVLTVPNAALRFTPSGATDEARPTGNRGVARAEGSKPERRESGGPKGKVWVLDANGQAKLVRVKTGLSDGSVTEVQSEELGEGTEVIVAQANATARPATGSTNPFAPQPFRR
ncbi:MAG: efflux RND transporter periplasmic adaptor subunit [Planctomycetes bacterium]|nr:efflux RND transporter periplasmic adaptor subunit [Planctomycetota bacterium]